MWYAYSGNAVGDFLFLSLISANLEVCYSPLDPQKIISVNCFLNLLTEMNAFVGDDCLQLSLFLAKHQYL